MNKKVLLGVVILFVVLGILFIMMLMPNLIAEREGVGANRQEARPTSLRSLVTPNGRIIYLRDDMFLNAIHGFFKEQISPSEFIMIADLQQMFQDADGLHTEIRVTIHPDAPVVAVKGIRADRTMDETPISIDDLRWGNLIQLELMTGELNTQVFEKDAYTPRRIMRLDFIPMGLTPTTEPASIP